MTPRLSASEVQVLAMKHFGVAGIAKEMGGERTQNFRLLAEDGRRFTFKVSDPNETEEAIFLENSALRHLEKADSSIAVPRLISSLSGEESVALSQGDNRKLRLLSYLEGTPISVVGESVREMRVSFGRALACLDGALADFHHTFAKERDLIWDVKNISRVRPYLCFVDSDRRSLVEEMLSRFEEVAAPQIDRLPSQAVHSDMNGQNVLVSKDERGWRTRFLDFGDIVYAPRIVDLAGAASLQISGASDDLFKVADVVRGFEAELPISKLERSLLSDFMIARCVINITVTGFLADRSPENRDYIMKNNPISWMRLQWLSSLPENSVWQS